MNYNKFYIKRCLDLAKLGRGRVAPNPIVGAVIVHENQIIGEGYHKKVGGMHAEIAAIHAVEETSLLKEATIYVSLEPCFHYGRTPPCVDSLLSYGFKEVVICQVDPNSKVKGKSIEKLKAHGVDVYVDVLREEGEQITQFFICRIKKRRPYIILKFAQTSNGIFGYDGQQLWISNAFSKRLSHRWRSEVGAILVGTNTAQIDNPKLDNRFYFGKSPLRVLLDRQLKVTSSAHLYTDDKPTLVVTEKIPVITDSKSVDYAQMTFDKTLIPNLLELLYQRGIDALFVEGGVYTLQQFLDQNLWDEARVFTGNPPTSPTDAKPLFAPILPVTASKKFQLDDNTLEIFYNK